MVCSSACLSRAAGNGSVRPSVGRRAASWSAVARTTPAAATSRFTGVPARRAARPELTFTGHESFRSWLAGRLTYCKPAASVNRARFRLPTPGVSAFLRRPAHQPGPPPRDPRKDMTSSPLQQLAQAVRRHGLIRFIEQYEAQFPTGHLKDVTVDEMGPGRQMVVQGRRVVNFGSDSFLGLDQDR